MRQFAECYQDIEFVQQLVAQIPWGHNILIMNINNVEEKVFYIEQTIQNNWSRNVLNIQIDSDLYHRQLINNKITNFNLTLPKIDSDLAIGLIKDPYKFEFLDLSAEAKELDIEKGLINHLKEFLLELGTGFAFVGEQYHIEVGGEDFYIDLLFYNRALSCLVPIELKMGKFKPEHIGQLNFYLEALDRDVKKSNENPSVGVILCATKDDAVVEYALSRSMSQAMVAEYTLQLPDKKLLENKLREITLLTDDLKDE